MKPIQRTADDGGVEQDLAAERGRKIFASVLGGAPKATKARPSISAALVTRRPVRPMH
jgi:hypothetical protein